MLLIRGMSHMSWTICYICVEGVQVACDRRTLRQEAYPQKPRYKRFPTLVLTEKMKIKPFMFRLWPKCRNLIGVTWEQPKWCQQDQEVGHWQNIVKSILNPKLQATGVLTRHFFSGFDKFRAEHSLPELQGQLICGQFSPPSKSLKQ
jgi:hypothetical protein